MKKKIEKSNKVSPKLEKWIPILETCNFPKEHYNLGAEYCNFHVKLESDYCSTFECKEFNLLPLSLYVLKEINLDNLKEYYLCDAVPSVQLFSAKLDEYSFDAMRHGGVATETILSHCENLIRKDSIYAINKMIEDSDEKIAEFGVIISSISVIAERAKEGETVFPQKIYVKTNIKIK